jgi:aminoglycoside phosphotransferase (APT) family kinase protein
MRENWSRASQTLEFTTDELTKMISPILPKRKVVASFYAQGGLANTNIRLKLSDTQTPLMLRVFTRDPSQAEKEYQIYQRIKGLVPAPQVYFYSPTNPVSGHPYSIMQVVEGDRLETLVGGLDDSWSVEVGRSVGDALAAIHSVTFERAGFFDGQLNIAMPISLGADGFIGFAQSCVEQSIVQQRLGIDFVHHLMTFVKSQSSELDSWRSVACLTHADFGGSNILVRKQQDGWKVSAVLDWEFALSASPFMDFGNLLRKPLGSVYSFESSVYEGYTARGGRLPANWRKLSKLVDLTAWLDFLTRPTANERLIEDARAVILETINENRSR